MLNTERTTNTCPQHQLVRTRETKCFCEPIRCTGAVCLGRLLGRSSTAHPHDPTALGRIGPPDGEEAGAIITNKHIARHWSLYKHSWPGSVRRAIWPAPSCTLAEPCAPRSLLIFSSSAAPAFQAPAAQHIEHTASTPKPHDTPTNAAQHHGGHGAARGAQQGKYCAMAAAQWELTVAAVVPRPLGQRLRGAHHLLEHPAAQEVDQLWPLQAPWARQRQRHQPQPDVVDDHRSALHPRPRGARSAWPRLVVVVAQ